MRNAYWLLTGAVLGFGLMAMFSIGIPIFLFGMVLALYRVWRVGGRGFGLVLVGMGLLPSVYLPTRYLTGGPNEFYPDDFWKGILVFVALAVLGALWFLVEARHPAQAAQRRG